MSEKYLIELKKTVKERGILRIAIFERYALGVPIVRGVSYSKL